MEDNSKLIGGMDKKERYKWGDIVTHPGELMWLSKHVLEVDATYQREHSVLKAQKLARSWDWTACGTILVGQRSNGKYMVLDGQHRVLAALRLSEISDLPCMVLQLDSIKEEAKTFRTINTNRTNVSAIDKFRAYGVEENPCALKVKATLTKYGVGISKSPIKRATKAVGVCMDILESNPDMFDYIISTSATLCVESPISKNLLQGLNYLSIHMDVPITDSRFQKRLKFMGIDKINSEIIKANIYLGHGVVSSARGILAAVNFGLVKKFSLKQDL